MSHTSGEWKSKMSPTGDRIIYVDTETGIEVICRDIRHWNTPIVKATPEMFQALVEMESYLVNRQPENTYQLEIIRKALAKAWAK
ncbi:hypothetical protein LCGC14_1384430 [marine sediment metagenome]|uniref:Uncharacterized protein n=1 Tax=marine sediment metagenome TaxID=412755 RepID=A0A0F9N3A2_9ZZZZ